MVDAFQIVRANLPFLGSALLVTIELNIASIALALALGTAMGIGRVYGGRWIDRGLGFIIDVVRSIPILVIMVWVFFGLPLLLGVTDFPAFLAGVLALGIHSGAYIAEIVRGGLGSVRGGQLHAALALGMSRPQAIARIILPQAAIRMMPPLSTRIVRNIKDFGAGQHDRRAGTVLGGQFARGRDRQAVPDLHDADGLLLPGNRRDRARAGSRVRQGRSTGRGLVRPLGCLAGAGR